MESWVAAAMALDRLLTVFVFPPYHLRREEAISRSFCFSLSSYSEQFSSTAGRRKDRRVMIKTKIENELNGRRLEKISLDESTKKKDVETSLAQFLFI